MTEKILKFNNIRLNKKEFIKSKEPIYLFSVDLGQIVVSEHGSKNMSFLIKSDEVWDKYDKIWDVIKDKPGIKFHSEPIYKYKYLKTKVRELDGLIKTNFLGKGMPK